MKFKFLQNWKEFLLVNYKLVIGLVACLMGIQFLQNYVSSPTLEILGFADSQDSSVSFDGPVVIKQIFVLPGQKLLKGQPLIEVEQQGLGLLLANTRSQLESLKSERRLRDTISLSLENNRQGQNRPKAKSPLDEEIIGLEKQLEHLVKQQDQSIRYAPLDGVITSIHYRVNESVAPFQPLLSFSSKEPNLIFGFVHENHISDISSGAKVQVASVAGTPRTIQGEVVSLGNRITLFPERLQSTSGLPTWGREVVVAIPSQNEFLMGEKVVIRQTSELKSMEFTLNQALAKNNTKAGGPAQITGVTQQIGLEIGGLYYRSADDTILMVSDDDGPNGSPFWETKLKDSAFKPKNLRWSHAVAVEDIESIASDNEHIYVLSSLAPRRSGKVSPDRHKLLRVSKESGTMRVDREMEIRSHLFKFLSASPLAVQFAQPLSTLEVEGFSLYNGDGYFALKSPQVNTGSPGFSLIVKATQLIKYFEANQGENIPFGIYNLVKLHDPQCKQPSHITDMIKDAMGLLILSVCKRKEAISQVWRLKNNQSSQQVQLISSIPHSRFEGMTFSDRPNEILLSSDNGTDNSANIVRIQLPIEN
jgi:multidrug efflux pump subunit AcrA (membrane-fusion protein)